jgi:dTDP-4-dehydrorhamnose reductase
MITGARGQVGHELRRSLLPLGPIAAFDRTQLDLADADAIVAVVRQLQPSLIVNAAAFTAVERAEDDVIAAEAINARAPCILAEEAARLGACLVHYSTDYVFDGRATRPYRESDATGPLNAYGRSKLAGEIAVRATSPTSIVLRCSWVYSARGASFLPTMQRLGRERDEVRVVDDQIGCPTWARYIAETTARMLESCGLSAAALRERTGIYHLAAGDSTSWCGFARAILAATPGCENTRVVPIASSEYPTKASRPAYSVLDTTRLCEVFGLFMPSWQSQLALALEDQQALGDTR